MKIVLDSNVLLAAFVCRDKDDNNVLHVGSFIEADYLIMGDTDLLVLSNYGGVRIISPRDFWIKIKQQES